MTTRTPTRPALTLALAATVLATALGGCRGDRSEKPPHRFIPDMDKQPKWDAQSETEFYENKRAQRAPVAGTVPFGTADFDPAAHAADAWAGSFLAERETLLKPDDAYYLGTDPAGPEGWAVYTPAPVTLEMLDRGRNRFEIYCTPCHGYLGDGNGSVGPLMNPIAANLHTELFTDRTQRQGTDGWIFNVVRNGVWGPDGTNRMPPYAHAIDEHDAWAVVAYLRALQASQNTPIDELPLSERERLQRQGAAPAGAGAQGGES